MARASRAVCLALELALAVAGRGAVPGLDVVLDFELLRALRGPLQAARELVEPL